MRCALFLLALAACQQPAGDDYPIHPGGGGGGGGGTGSDAALDDGGGDAGPTIAGRACLLSDLRDHGTCAASGAGGLTVTLGTKTATTASDGTFQIAIPAGTGLEWRISGPAIATSLMVLGAAHRIPVVDAVAYSTFVTDHGILLAEDQGSIFARLVRGTAPVLGATATVDPPSPNAIYYDGGSASTWDQDTTGGFGVAWLPGVGIGTATVTVTPMGGTAAATTVSVAEQAITFTTIEVP